MSTTSDLRVDLCGIDLVHPVLNGSGTFDAIAAHDVFGDALLSQFPFSAFVSKTITPEPRPGNPPPRLWEETEGLINSIGLPNKGLSGFLEKDLPRLASVPVPLIVSVMATSTDEFAELVRSVSERSEVAAIELNVSCPNVKSGLVVGESPEECSSLLSNLRGLTDKPMIVKLTPGTDPVPVAVAAEASGADAFSLVNTLKASPLSPAGDGHWLGAVSGGLSGPTIRDLALAQVSAVAEGVALPVIGMGGISNGDDARSFLAAGASAIAVGTENFRDPEAGTRIARELGYLG
jgi:dihydroorotate dehydrogenase (NAD+) catalytic subunit